MKRVLRADFFELRKSKTVWMLPLIAVLMGFLLPMMYYGIVVLFDKISELPGLESDSMASLKVMMNTLTAKTVFYSCLPFSQGFGFVMAAILGFRAVRPFGTGIYRNKVIAQIPRGSIYLSQLLYCELLAMVSVCIFTVVTALMTRMTFGPLELSGRAIWVLALLSFGIYLVYTAICVFAAFLTRSILPTILIGILTPVLAQTVFSLTATALSGASDVLKNLMSVLPSIQSTYMADPQTPDKILWISIVSDAAITAILTLIGVFRFKRTDLN